MSGRDSADDSSDDEEELESSLMKSDEMNFQLMEETSSSNMMMMDDAVDASSGEPKADSVNPFQAMLARSSIGEAAPLDAKELATIAIDYWGVHVPQVFDYNATTILVPPPLEDVIYDELLRPVESFILGGDPDTELQRIKDDDKPPALCGKVFKSGEPTFCCRDCGMDPTCVLCINCFNKSAHKKHRYRMAASGGGGYCDCGDVEAWKRDPFCEYHLQGSIAAETTSENDDAVQSSLPEGVKERGDAMLMVCFDYCNLMLNWDGNEAPPANYAKLLSPRPKGPHLTMLFNDEVHTYQQVTDALQRACGVTEKQATEHAARVDREGRSPVRFGSLSECQAVKADIQKRSTQTLHGPRKPLKVEVCEANIVGHQAFSQALLSWLVEFSAKGGPAIRDQISDALMRQQISGLTYAERFVLGETKLWKSVRTQLHQLLMATVLMESSYKKSFSLMFARHYANIQRDFIDDDHDHSLSVTSLSVQILTVPTISKMLIAEENLLATLFNTFWSETESKVGEKGVFVFNRPARGIANDQSYRRANYVLMDPKYVLTTTPTVEEWRDEKMRDNFQRGLEVLLQILSAMQGMDPVIRQVQHHIEFEPEWETAFNLQLKLHSVLNQIIEWTAAASENSDVLLRAFRATVDALYRRSSPLRRIPVTLARHIFLAIEYDISKDSVSVHLPLTRLLAGLYLQLGKFGLTYYSPELMMSDTTPHPHRLDPIDLMEQPLRVIVLVAQSYAGMWRRNGYSLLNQLYLYQNVRCRGEMFDRDVETLQICASLLDPNEFLIQVINRFGLIEWLQEGFESSTSKKKSMSKEMLAEKKTGASGEEEDAEARMKRDIADEMLALLIVILSERYVPGIGQVTASDCTRREVIHSLCTGAKTHSEMLKTLVEDANHETGLESVVDAVADFNRSTKKYQVKDAWLKDFNLFYYHYSRSEQTKAEEEIRKRHRSLDDSSSLSAMAPPLPPPFVPTLAPVLRLCDCDVMMLILRTIVVRAHMDSQPSTFSESHLLMALHLIGLSLHEENRCLENDELSFQFLTKAQEVDWLPHDSAAAAGKEVSPAKEASPSLSSSTTSLSSLSPSSTSLLTSLERLASDSRFEALRSLLSATKRQLSAVTKLQRQKTAIKLMDTADEDNANASGEAINNDDEEEDEATRKEKEQRKMKAKALANERRAKIMAQMASMQRAFIAENKDQFDSTSTESAMADESETSTANTVDAFPVALGPKKTQRPTAHGPARVETCILCQEDEEVTSSSIGSSTSSTGRSGVVVMAAFAQRSNVLAATTRIYDEPPPTPEELDTDDSHLLGAAAACSSSSQPSLQSPSSFLEPLKNKNSSASSGDSGLPRKISSGSLSGGAAGDSSSSSSRKNPKKRSRSRHSTSSSSISSSALTSSASISGTEEGAVASTSAAAASASAASAAAASEAEDESTTEYDPLFTRASLANGTHLSSCGHVMHAECWQRFFDAVVQRETRRRQRYVSSYDVEKNCFLCPMCESLCNAAMPVLPQWNIRGWGAGEDDDDEDKDDDDEDKDDKKEKLTSELGDFVDRLRLMLNNSFRKKPKPKLELKSSDAKAKESGVGSAAARRTAGLRRLSGMTTTTTMTPAEIIGAILNSVGVLEEAAAGRAAGRRRTTSTPPGLGSTSASAAAVDDELVEEGEEDKKEKEYEWEVSATALDESFARGDFSAPDWRSFLRMWRQYGTFQDDSNDEPFSIHPTGVMMLQNVSRNVYTLALETDPDDHNPRMTSTIRTAAAYSIRAMESVFRSNESGITTGTEGAFHRSSGFSSTLISSADAAAAATDAAAETGAASEAPAAVASASNGGGSSGVGLSERQMEWLRVMSRLAATVHCMTSVNVTRDQALRLVTCLIPGVEPPKTGDSYSRPPPALTLDPFVTLVNLVYSFPSLLRGDEEAASRGQHPPTAKNSEDPRLPVGGVVDHLLLRLTAALRLTQILLATEDDVEGSLTPTNESDPMEVDGDQVGGEEEEEEKRELVACWRRMRVEAGYATKIPTRVTPAQADSLYLSVVRKLTPFLRCSSLFFHLLTEVPTPKRSAADKDIVQELKLLLRYLDLPPNLTLLLQGPGGSFSVWVRHWYSSHFHSSPALEAAASTPDIQIPPPALVLSPLAPRRLIPLPFDFSDVINRASSFVCPNAALSAASAAAAINDSRAPIICLLCGVMLCSSQNLCCQEQLEEGTIVGPCVAHARKCGAGIGVLLSVSKCQVILLSDKEHGCFYSPPYVDDYGETDEGLRRGNPLFFCQESYTRLEDLWLNHRIPQTIVRVLEANPNHMAVNWHLW